MTCFSDLGREISTLSSESALIVVGFVDILWQDEVAILFLLF